MFLFTAKGQKVVSQGDGENVLSIGGTGHQGEEQEERKLVEEQRAKHKQKKAVAGYKKITQLFQMKTAKKEENVESIK